MQDIVVFLNGSRGIEVIKELIKSGHGISACVVPQKKIYDQVQREIENISLNCLRVDNVNSHDVILHLKGYNAKLFIIAGFSTIFSENLINLPKLGTMNLHAGRLPNYRGGSPLNWQIINGEPKATISVIKVDQGIDTGEILQEEEIVIDSSTDIRDLHKEANKLFPKLMSNVISKIDKNHDLSGRRQNSKDAAYWHQRNDSDGHLNFKKMDCFQVSCFVRALTSPYPGAWSYLFDKKVRILKVEIPDFDLFGVSGRICYIQKKGPYIICKDKGILIKKYLIENNPNLSLKNGQYLT